MKKLQCNRTWIVCFYLASMAEKKNPPCGCVGCLDLGGSISGGSNQHTPFDFFSDGESIIGTLPCICKQRSIRPSAWGVVLSSVVFSGQNKLMGQKAIRETFIVGYSWFPPPVRDKTVSNGESEANITSQTMAKRVGASRGRNGNERGLSRPVSAILDFVRLAEFEILFFLFFFIAFLVFKDLTSRPEYNQILVKKPGGPDWWPY